jgi:hypothetical protein
MNLYLIEADTSGYDVFSEAVVAAVDADAARLIHPGGYDYPDWTFDRWQLESWDEPRNVRVKLLAKAVNGTKPGVICASFHAG